MPSWTLLEWIMMIAIFGTSAKLMIQMTIIISLQAVYPLPTRHVQAWMTMIDGFIVPECNIWLCACL